MTYSIDSYDYDAATRRRDQLRGRVALGVAAVMMLGVGIKLAYNAAEAGGEDRPAGYICLSDNAHGHPGSDVVLWSGENNEPPTHTLDLPDGVKGVCYPTEDGTARTSEDTYNYANGEWVLVRFGEVQRAVKRGTAVDETTGRPIDSVTAGRLQEFASNWPIDIFGPQYAWVNEVTAGIPATKPHAKK